jgi:glutamate formiminotransferase/formiminotetrahydrofolate cyclodeaminase
MDCFGMPKKTDSQLKAKGLATAAATRLATSVPLSVLVKIPALLELAKEVAEIGNVNSLSDAGVAGLTALAGAEGAYYNVLINLESLKDMDQSEDSEFYAETLVAAKKAMALCEENAQLVKDFVRGKLEKAVE